jgi:hypothetical protein
MDEDDQLIEMIDFESIFDLKLSEKEYGEKLHALLDTSGLGIVAKRKVLRQKLQEFKDEKRRPHHELEEEKEYY